MQNLPSIFRSPRAIGPLAVLALLLLAQISSIRVPGLTCLLVGALGLSLARNLARRDPEG